MQSRTKVLLLIKGLGLGGAEKLLTMALPHLDRERYEYEVAYLLPWKNALVPEFERHGIRVSCLGQRKPYDPRAVLRLARLMRKSRPQVVHAHLPYAEMVAQLASPLAPSTARVYTEHNVFDRYHPLTRMFHKRLFPRNDAVIFVSEAVRASVLSNMRVNGRPKLHTIYNGVDWQAIERHQDDRELIRQELAIPRGNRVLVTVASFTPKKRHEDLLAAARMVLKDCPDTSFVLVGDGPLRPQIEQMATEMGLRSNVVFTGLRQDAISIVAASDAFVLPSRAEGLPIVVLEAMALEKPVVATRVGGVPEVICDQQDGLLVDALDPPALATALVGLLNDPAKGRRLAQAAKRRLVSQFDMRRTVRETEAVYQESLGRRKAG